MADSASDLRADIEKLERKHNENPEGRFLVPLATLHRKAGNAEMAEALLREALNRRPENLSAHVVLGGCLLDRQVLRDAADEFKYVLSADPQNLIALRSLGEIARAEDDFAQADHWYRELLAVDPLNEDARQALADLAAATPAPDRAAEAEGDAILTLEHTDLREATPSGDALPLDGDDLDFSPMDAGLVDLRTPAALPQAEPEEPEPEEDRRYAAWDPSMMTLESPMWNEADAAPADADHGREDGFSFGDDDTLFGDAISLDAGEADAVADADAAGGVVTETIAELYSRQGFHDRAVDVYRELIRRRGEEPALVERLREAERRLAADEGAAHLSLETGVPDAEPQLGPGTEAPDPEEPALATAETTTDAFADSFAGGFAGMSAAAPEEMEPPEVGLASMGDEQEPPNETASFAILSQSPSAEDAREGGEDTAEFYEMPSLDAGGFLPPGRTGVSAAPPEDVWAPPSPPFAETSPEVAESPAPQNVPDFGAPAAEELTGREQTEADQSDGRPAAAAVITARQYLAALAMWPSVPDETPASPLPYASAADAAATGDRIAAAETDPDRGDAAWAREDAAGEPQGALVEPASGFDEPTVGQASPDETWADEELPWMRSFEPAADEPPTEEPPTEEGAYEWGTAEELAHEPPVVEEPATEKPADAALSLPEMDGFTPAEQTEPWDEHAEGEAEPEAAPFGDEADLFPWETSPTADAVPEVSPPQEEQPAAPAGGEFSFDTFFAEPAAPAQFVEEPAAPISPPPPTQPPAPAASEPSSDADEEDLESFQVWLRSLKR